jgi:serine/threonine protein kinase
VYSLGLTLYEAITGVLPFPRCSDEEMARLKLTRKPPSPRTFVPELPLGLEAIVRQAVETNRDLRYRNAIDMARDLERFANYRRVDTREHPGAGNYDGDGDGDGDTERDDDAPEMALA